MDREPVWNRKVPIEATAAFPDRGHEPARHPTSTSRQLPSHDDLIRLLGRLDGRGYKAYKEIRGRWDFADFRLGVDHVQGDPFADPSRASVLLSPSVAGLPPEVLTSSSRIVGVASLLARRFHREAHQRARPRGSGKSGDIRIAAPGQEVLRQTAVRVMPDGAVEARFRVGLPAAGRRVMAREAVELLVGDVPFVVRASLRGVCYSAEELLQHAEVNEDADALRALLPGMGLVAFVADGAVLPRRSGIEQAPMLQRAVPFESPSSLRVTVDLPNGGSVSGTGIPRGVTLIVGGGYHGKSTLLEALERGVYNHRPGDGRERVVSDPTAVKIRAEDGRSIVGVDISPFIGPLPLGQDTRRFDSTDASGSTSQAAAIVEALEAGARTLLVDEDTAATNFMIRDRRMQALVPREKEPITPFVDRVGLLHSELGVSSVIVLGGSGDYLDVADTVIAMDSYRARDLTAEAKAVAERMPTGRLTDAVGGAFPQLARVPLASSLEPRRGRRAESIKVRSPRAIEFGEEAIDLAYVVQIVARTQLRGIARALLLAREHYLDGRRSLSEVLDAVLECISEEGLDVLDARRPGDLAEFRRFELAAALNRLRTLELAE